MGVHWNLDDPMCPYGHLRTSCEKHRKETRPGGPSTMKRYCSIRDNENKRARYRLVNQPGLRAEVKKTREMLAPKGVIIRGTWIGRGDGPKGTLMLRLVCGHVVYYKISTFTHTEELWCQRCVTFKHIHEVSSDHHQEFSMLIYPLEGTPLVPQPKSGGAPPSSDAVKIPGAPLCRSSITFGGKKVA